MYSVRAWSTLAWPHAAFRMQQHHHHEQQQQQYSRLVRHQQYSFFSTKLFFSAIDEDMAQSTAAEDQKTVQSEWNVSGLKKEVTRLLLRSHKKLAKATQKRRRAQEEVDALLQKDDASVEELEACPDVDAIELEVKELQDRVQGLNKLEESLQNIKKKAMVLPEPIAQLAIDLGVNDMPPAPQPRGPGKAKGPRQQASRKPYRRYLSFDNTEIRVGKRAEDNDDLSLSPEHRDGADWWMHASGCPGSHVVIRCHDDNLSGQVIQDAAALAARHSKCYGASVIKVSLTRCRDIKKPPGAKAGLVQLTGTVKTVTVNMKEAQARLDRLDKTVMIN